LPYFFGHREGERVEIRGPDARHLARSLRARPGERISVVQPEGRLLSVRLTAVDPGLVVGEVEEETPHEPEPEREVTMAVAMLPAPALDLTLSRCTEVGAAAFLLVGAERSVGRGARPERWAGICREAAMLAGRLRVPEVRGPLSFAEAWSSAVEPRLLHRSGPPLEPIEGPATLFVGPEGGWSPAELELAAGRLAGLGPRNLRADTAALVGLTLALAGQCP
jgi:16S rRNA (uracil1498-N3)-methyltransferase